MICKEMSLRHPSANLGWRPVIADMTVQYTWWDVNCLGSTTVNSSSVWPWTPLCPAAEQDTAAGSICSERLLKKGFSAVPPLICFLSDLSSPAYMHVCSAPTSKPHGVLLVSCPTQTILCSSLLPLFTILRYFFLVSYLHLSHCMLRLCIVVLLTHVKKGCLPLYVIYTPLFL